MRNGTILIVDDEELNFYLLQILLLKKLKLSCKLVHLENGQLAVDYCENNTHINLILMDIKMPVMNGLEATKLIKNIYPNLPIVAQSAYSTREDKTIAINAGCDDFISKPINKEVLENIVKKHL